MPTVTGLDMLEFVRRRDEWKSLPVIMLSSEAADVQVDTAMELGADAYVFKPVTLEELEAALKTAESKRKMQIAELNSAANPANNIIMEN